MSTIHIRKPPQILSFPSFLPKFHIRQKSVWHFEWSILMRQLYYKITYACSSHIILSCPFRIISLTLIPWLFLFLCQIAKFLKTVAVKPLIRNDFLLHNKSFFNFEDYNNYYNVYNNISLSDCPNSTNFHEWRQIYVSQDNVAECSLGWSPGPES